MEKELISAVFAGLGGMLGWGLADFFAKKTINDLGDVATLAWAHVVGTGILFGVILYKAVNSQPIQLLMDVKTLIFLLFFGILQAAVYLFVYSGFRKGQVALLSPIFASFSGFTAIISIIVFGEIINIYLFIGLAILFLGILFINLDLQALQSKQINFVRIPGIPEVIIATILAVIWTLFWDQFINGKDWLVCTFVMYAFMTLAILIFAKFRGVKLDVVKTSLWKFLGLIGLCEIFAYLAISWGYSTTPLTSVVALLGGAFSLPTIFLAQVFLKERITFLQAIGCLIIILGIMILSVL